MHTTLVTCRMAMRPHLEHSACFIEVEALAGQEGDQPFNVAPAHQDAIRACPQLLQIEDKAQGLSGVALEAVLAHVVHGDGGVVQAPAIC